MEKLYQLFLTSDGVSTDTRSLKPGQIYVALKGENFDGNSFVPQALEKGAVAAVVSDSSFTGPEIFQVEDTLETLQALAVMHRERMSFPVLGITGSNGKTTTKELIAAVLAKKYHISFTQGNLNNHIGVPLSVLSVPSDCEIAVIEMGANHVGEIAALCKISRPTCGLITNIGLAHIEGFGGVEGIKRGKSELYHWLAANEGLAFVNRDEKYLDSLSSHVPNRVFYGTDAILENGYRFDIISDQDEIRIKGGTALTSGIDLHSGLFGNYNARNILTAVTIGLHFGVEPNAINKAVAEYVPQNNRSQHVRRGDKLVILDAYNANPTSMQLAVENLSRRKGVKAAIIGGMNELGVTTDREHQDLVELINSLGIDSVFYVGEHYDKCHLPESALAFAHVDDLIGYLEHNEIPADVILIKGSRSIKLESALGHIH